MWHLGGGFQAKKKSQLTCIYANPEKVPNRANLPYFMRFFHNKLARMTLEKSWPILLGKLLDKGNLDRAEASWAMGQIMAGDATEAQMGAFMLALRSKGETVDELAGLVDVMLQHSVILDTGSDAVDIVGTGGDLVGTVNISSMASIVASAAGVPVMKHGSRSASGKTGSSEMLEVLGIRLDLSPDRVAEVFRQIGLTFFFAPVFHPAMRFVAPVRKQLGVPTTFNFLGPLANPAQPVATSLGVANRQIAPLMAAEMAARGRNALVFRGSDGLDELTTTGSSEIWLVQGGEAREFGLNPSDFGLKTAKLQELIGGDPQHNAQVTRSLFTGDLSGNLAAVREVVALNAAGGLVAYGLSGAKIDSQQQLDAAFKDALAKTFAAIDSGAAAEKLSQWTAATQAD
jgi:anthranilate phosphoribosyltransferase